MYVVASAALGEKSAVKRRNAHLWHALGTQPLSSSSKQPPIHFHALHTPLESGMCYSCVDSLSPRRQVSVGVCKGLSDHTHVDEAPLSEG